MMRYPTKDRLKAMEKKLENVEGAHSLPEDATPMDKLKYDLCREMIAYLLMNRLSQKDLADELGVDPAVVSRIVNYNIEYFTIDTLGAYISIVKPDVQFKVDYEKKAVGE